MPIFYNVMEIIPNLMLTLTLAVETHDTVMTDAIFKSHAFQWEPSHCDVDHRFEQSDR